MSGAGRILHVTDKAPGGGGIAQTIARYQQIAGDGGWQSRVLRLVPNPSGPDEAPLRFGRSRDMDHPAVHALEQAARGADLIHLHLGFTALTPAAIAALAGLAPLVVSLHDVSFACENGLPTGVEAARARPDGWARSMLRSALRGRIKDSARTLAFAPARAALRHALAQHARVVLAPSRYLEDMARAAGLARVTRLPHAVAACDPLPPGPATCGPRVLYMGRLSVEKGAMLALDAMAHLPGEATLTLCGAGPLDAALNARARQVGLSERVQFAGWCDPDTLADHLAQARVVVQPSLVPEGFGLSVIEAAAAGRACVTLQRGAHAELDLAALDPSPMTPAPKPATPTAKALGEALTPYVLDPGFAQAQGRLAQERAKKFDPETQAAALLALYARLARRGDAQGGTDAGSGPLGQDGRAGGTCAAFV